MADKSERALKEEKILQFWKENKIFEKSLEKEAPQGEFVFYEGPPTANAAPALHHLVSRVFKDALPRYKTMQGFHVPRKAGWDTHGLPVELQIEKRLGLKSKKEIETYGVERFNKEAKQSVFEYIGEWEKFTERIGYWVDFKNAYYTFYNSYIEALWGVLAHVEKRELLYKDYKVLPWCPRCGTALSSHELAQGYQDVKDLSLYVKFKVKNPEKLGISGNVSLVAWTTTPWTLPGNIALAVNPNITYGIYKWVGEYVILAKERASKWPGHIEKEVTGTELVGLQYEPNYVFFENNYDFKQVYEGEKAFRVYPADFVTTEDGTGIVHTAVMYGQEDFDLGTKVGLPKFHLVNPEGVFIPGTDWLAGRSVVDETLAVDILKDLQGRGLLFDKENHTHSYPFCWRCKTRLIYYARDSWYIAMSKLRKELIKENEKIHWEPEYIKEGRFGEWLREIKDWAISRERYWGTPLPVWEALSDSKKRIVVNSIDTLKKYTKTNGNKFIFIRHGEAGNNAQAICNSNPSEIFHLTENGKEQVKTAAGKITKVNAIYTSPYTRAKETAEIIAEKSGFDKNKIKEDERLKELNFGDFDGKPFSDYVKFDEKNIHAYDTPLPRGESYNDAKKRFGEFLYEIDRLHKNETVVVSTHGMGLEAVLAIIEGASLKRSKEIIDSPNPNFHVGGMVSFDFTPLSHNENFELDLHRPYIDKIVLEKDGEEYRRVKEVMDVWFDSGAMPFAQDPKNVRLPADFISEAIDQTRGWFYTLHAIGVLMGKGHVYNNVICLGHILDKEGKKMSKSIGNILDPWELIDKYGVDTLRLWMYSVNQPGESKNFDERSVDELQKRVFNLLDNVYSFYELYRDKELEGHSVKSENRLDKWILSRLAQLIERMTKNLDNYKLLEPVRETREFIDDLSTWYLRRSRERIKDGDKEAKQTLYFVLKNISKLLAPLAPFVSEDLYQKLRNEKDPLSVHMENWPQAGDVDADLLTSMAKTRELASRALEQRSKVNIKVRQPLAKLEVRILEINVQDHIFLKEEINVGEIKENPNLETEVKLDTTITPELEEEGRVRDAIRAIQEWRKESNLKPGELTKYTINNEQEEFFRKHAEEIKKVTNVEFN